MLLCLKIQNFALIRKLEFSPQAGLNVITGETGAGKSILLGALGLVLGNRAETSVLLNKEEKCIVEAEFELDEAEFAKLFAANDLDFEKISIFRREITPQGKSRAFINDTPVALSVMKDVGASLIQVHTQNTGLLVAEQHKQIEIVDAYARHSDLLAEYQTAFNEWKEALRNLEELKTKQAEFQREQDFIRYQFDELQDFQPIENEETQLPAQIELLSSAGELKEAYRMGIDVLTDGDDSVADRMGRLKSLLKHVFRLSEKGEDLRQRLDALIEDIKELSRDLDRETGAAESNPELLEQLNTRLARLQLLLRKHNQNSAGGLLETMRMLEGQMLESNLTDEKIEHTAKAVEAGFVKVQQLGLKLHESRETAAVSLLEQTTALLQKLGMPRAQMQAKWSTHIEKPLSGGISSLSLLFSANPGAPLQTIDKIASGGEMSRVNFCFKRLLGEKKNLPTLIYDEADTGVSGEVAAQMGLMMREMGRQHQVIAITHLPQVAAAGNYHYFIYKEENADSTESRMRMLNDADTLQQLAMMLSGGEPGEAAKANAAELQRKFNF
jgi:DNA repair protein RecN (Recombination protein N)